LARGADIDLPEHQGWTPLFWASFNGYADIVGQLIARGADANAVTHVGDRPLFMATYKRGMRTWCVYCWRAARGGTQSAPEVETHCGWRA